MFVKNKHCPGYHSLNNSLEAANKVIKDEATYRIALLLSESLGCVANEIVGACPKEKVQTLEIRTAKKSGGIHIPISPFQFLNYAVPVAS